MRNRDHPDPRIPERLERFAEFIEAETPMYASFARAAADDPVALDVLLDGDHSQPPPNLLLGAVHYLLLDGRAHPLAAHYGIGTASAKGDPVALFLDFVHEQAGEIREQVVARRVQTNEVRRSVLYVAALGHVEHSTDSPLYLIEIGASAGLNLCFDRYRYDYGIATTGPVESPLLLTTEVRAGRPPIPSPLPDLVGRIGVDINPIDLSDPDVLRWSRALLWPEQPERRERFDTAASLLLGDPPPIIRGDGYDLLPELVAAVPDDARVVVLHSFALYQASEERRDAYGDLLRQLSVERTIDRISIESLTREAPQMVHTRYRDDAATETMLGHAHHHGAWLEWSA